MKKVNKTKIILQWSKHRRPKKKTIIRKRLVASKRMLIVKVCLQLICRLRIRGMQKFKSQSPAQIADK